MADIHYQMSAISNGLQYLEQGLQLIPDSTMIAYRKLLYLVGLKRWNEAEQWLELIFDHEQLEEINEIESMDPTICEWIPYAMKKKYH
jgi:hypothetical protein